MMPLGWALTQSNRCSYKRGNLDIGTKDVCAQGKGHVRIQGEDLPSARGESSGETKPADIALGLQN